MDFGPICPCPSINKNWDWDAEIGHERFNRDEAAEKIKKHIEEQNRIIEVLLVEFNHGGAIAGQATSGEEMDKALLIAGNVQTIGMRQ